MCDKERMRRLTQVGVRLAPSRATRHSVGGMPRRTTETLCRPGTGAGRRGLLSGFGAEPEFWDPDNWTMSAGGDITYHSMRSSDFTAKFQDSGKLRMFSDTSLSSLIRHEARKAREEEKKAQKIKARQEVLEQRIRQQEARAGRRVHRRSVLVAEQQAKRHAAVKIQNAARMFLTEVREALCDESTRRAWEDYKRMRQPTGRAFPALGVKQVAGVCIIQSWWRQRLMTKDAHTQMAALKRSREAARDAAIKKLHHDAAATIQGLFRGWEARDSVRTLRKRKAFELRNLKSQAFIRSSAEAVLGKTLAQSRISEASDQVKQTIVRDALLDGSLSPQVLSSLYGDLRGAPKTIDLPGQVPFRPRTADDFLISKPDVTVTTPTFRRIHSNSTGLRGPLSRILSKDRLPKSRLSIVVNTNAATGRSVGAPSPGAFSTPGWRDGNGTSRSSRPTLQTPDILFLHVEEGSASPSTVRSDASLGHGCSSYSITLIPTPSNPSGSNNHPRDHLGSWRNLAPPGLPRRPQPKGPLSAPVERRVTFRIDSGDTTTHARMVERNVGDQASDAPAALSHAATLSCLQGSTADPRDGLDFGVPETDEAADAPVGPQVATCDVATDSTDLGHQPYHACPAAGDPSDGCGLSDAIQDAVAAVLTPTKSRLDRPAGLHGPKPQPAASGELGGLPATPKSLSIDVEIGLSSTPSLLSPKPLTHAAGLQYGSMSPLTPSRRVMSPMRASGWMSPSRSGRWHC